MTTINRLLGFIIFQSFIKSIARLNGAGSAIIPGNLLRLLTVKHQPSGNRTTQTPRQAASHSRRNGVDWRLLALCAVLLLPLLAACTRNIGGEGNGWNAPVSKDGVVYVGTKEGEVKAYIDSGFEGVRESWTFRPFQSEATLGGVYNTPLVVGDLVYVSAQDGFLYAIDKETGTLGGGTGWRMPQGQPADLEPLIAGPAYDPLNDLILAPSEDGRLYAYDAKSGEQAWNPFPTGAAIWSTPAVDNGIGYFGSHDHKVYAVTLSNGEELWQFETGGVVAGKPLVFDGKVIAGSFDRKLYALSAKTGAVQWTFEGTNWFWAGAITDGRTIFAPNMDGNIYALDTNGNLLWKHDVGSSIVSPPVLVSRGLIVAAKDGKLILLDTRVGNLGVQRELSNLTLGDAEIKAPLFADGDSVFIGSQDSTVRRVEVQAGQIIMWCRHTVDGQCKN